MKAAIEARQQHTGYIEIAIPFLEDPMRSGKLRSMRHDLATGSRERLDRSFWDRHVLDVMPGTGSVVAFRVTGARRTGAQRPWVTFDHYPDQRMDAHAYFVWRADLDKLFGVPFSSGEENASDQQDAYTPTTAKTGPKPRGNWPVLIEQWLPDGARDYPHGLGNVDQLVVEAENFLRNRIGWAPSNPKRLRAKIRELLRTVRS
jgi:hypothetical protein